MHIRAPGMQVDELPSRGIAFKERIGPVHIDRELRQVARLLFVGAAMATAWPWPYPATYKQQASYLPKLTVNMNRADPFFERDATGWQFINLHTGRTDVHYQLPGNQNRVVAWDERAGHPVDTQFQAEAGRIPPQRHY